MSVFLLPIWFNHLNVDMFNPPCHFLFWVVLSEMYIKTADDDEKKDKMYKYDIIHSSDYLFYPLIIWSIKNR